MLADIVTKHLDNNVLNPVIQKRSSPLGLQQENTPKTSDNYRTVHTKKPGLPR